MTDLNLYKKQIKQYKKAKEFIDMMDKDFWPVIQAEMLEENKDFIQEAGIANLKVCTRVDFTVDQEILPRTLFKRVPDLETIRIRYNRGQVVNGVTERVSTYLRKDLV